jgi:outer membrane protein assembly factor BamB
MMVEPRDGSVIWERKISPGWSAYPAVADDRVVLASTTRQVYVVTLPGGQMESVKTVPADVTVLAAAEGVIYTGDSQGRISRFENGADEARWRFRSGGEVSSLSLVDGHIMAASHDNFIYYLDAVRGGVAWKRRLAGRAIFAADYMGQYALTAVYDAHTAMLLDLNNGKPAGQILLPADEVPVATPVISNGHIYVLTNGALTAYSKTGCTQKNGSTGN